MVSDFRKKKIIRVFNFFDTDHSGSIDKKDFDLAIATIAEKRGFKVGDAKYKEVEASLLKVWEGLQRADTNNDGQVSQDEWVALWDQYSQNPGEAAEWQTLYSKFVYQVQDVTGDGAIDVDEFVAVSTSFGLDKDKSVEAFNKLSKGKAAVTWPDFQELWKEYISSEDPAAPGNFIFGYKV